MSLPEIPASTYERAERLLGHNRSRLVLHSKVELHWIGDGRRFWYRIETARGGEFVLIDPASGVREPAFDQEQVAAAFEAAAGTTVDAYALPFGSIEIEGDDVMFDAFGSRWSVSRSTSACQIDSGRLQAAPGDVVSPDGEWSAFRREHDVWARSLRTGDEFPLTRDGTADESYAANPDHSSGRRLYSTLGMAEPAAVLLWSPDSTRILTHRMDQREVGRLYLTEAAPPDGGRPRLHSYHYPIPGDDVQPRGEWVVLDVVTRTLVRAAGEPFPMPFSSPIVNRAAWWAADGGAVYYLDHSRDVRTLRLHSVDPETGAVRDLFDESGPTRVDAVQEFGLRPCVRVLASGREALWYSQRDGRGHLYLVDLEQGRVSRQVTSGDYSVRQIEHVDEQNRIAYVTVSGLVDGDPYRRSLVSIGLDGHPLTRITVDDLDHAISTPPHGQWFVDSASTVGTPPVTTVRDPDGAVLMELERADIRGLIAAGWTPPERIRTVAADGTTPIYGLLYKPFDFDPDHRYPVIDHPYPGPQAARVRPSFDQGFDGHEADALAALGFVVVAVDGRGTPGRDKAFHDYSYRNLGSAGSIEDHVAALTQLAETRPWMDLDRVGVFGVSAGAYAAVRSMAIRPDLYKVGVAESGNHDNRFYHAFWSDSYDDPDDAAARTRASNTEVAGALEGKLLLVHGEMDDNVNPQLTLRLVDRLIAANKDFDLLIVPGGEHTLAGYQDYVTRRRWDYFIRNLLDRTPPPGYRLAPIPPTARLDNP